MRMSLEASSLSRCYYSFVSIGSGFWIDRQSTRNYVSQPSYGMRRRLSRSCNYRFMSAAIQRAPTLQLEDALRNVADARIAVFGDFCLDAYWALDAEEPQE